MQFDGSPFPSELPLFPPHSAVREYLQEYGKDVRHLITFNAKVIDCRKQGNLWEVLFTNTCTKRMEAKRVYDAVLIAVGHYNVPYIPSVPGLKQWAAAYPGSVSHSKHFRKPDIYSAKVTVVYDSILTS